MGRAIYIKEIILSASEPKICPTCKKQDRLQQDEVFERRSDGRTILCTRCESLVVITEQNLKKVELVGAKDNSIMLKEPHLIRKITY